MFTTSGDEFFLPCDTRNFWNELVQVTDGTALLRRLPNAEHSMKGHSLGIFLNLISFYISAYDVRIASSSSNVPNKKFLSLELSFTECKMDNAEQ